MSSTPSASKSEGRSTIAARSTGGSSSACRASAELERGTPVKMISSASVIPAMRERRVRRGERSRDMVILLMAGITVTGNHFGCIRALPDRGANGLLNPVGGHLAADIDRAGLDVVDLGTEQPLAGRSVPDADH